MYKLMILSYLALQDQQQALNTANEYRARIGGPEPERWLEMVQRYPQDKQFLQNLLNDEITGRSSAIAKP